MTVPRFAIGIFVAALLVAAVLLGMQLGARQGADPTRDAVVAPGPSPAAGPTDPLPVDSAPPPASVAAARDPLPPLDTPLADVFDDLAARADRGDHQAACRLAFELQACSADLAQLRLAGRAAEGLASVDTDAMEGEQLAGFERQMASISRQFDARDALEAHCAGVPEVPRGRQVGWWRQAALAGNPEAARGYVTGEALPVEQWMQNLGAVEQMRRDLEPLAWRQMQAGDVTMAWHLMMAHARSPSLSPSGPLTQALEPDPEQALALAFYLREALPRAAGAGMAGDELQQYLRRLDSWVGQFGADTDAAQLARAEAQGRAWSRDIRPMEIPQASTSTDVYGPGWNDERLESCSEG